MSGAGFSDEKLKILRDQVAAANDQINFVQAEQTLLMRGIEKFGKNYALTINKNGYSNGDGTATGKYIGSKKVMGGVPSKAFYALWDSKNPQTILDGIYNSDTFEKQNFLDNIYSANSNLAPDVKLFRVYRDPLVKTKILGQRKIDISNARFNRTLNDPDKKGLFFAGKYGLTNMNMAVKNQNPFAASRMVEVQMSFMMENISVLDIPDSKGSKLRDLMTFSGKSVVNQDNYDGYQLKLVVGYQDVKAATGDRIINTKKYPNPNVLKAISEASELNTYTLMLQLVDYDLSVQPSGETELTLTYVSFIEDFAKRASVDIFAGRIMTSHQIKDHSANSSQTAVNTLKAYTEAESNLKKVERVQKQVNQLNASIQEIPGYSPNFFTIDDVAEENQGRFESLMQQRNELVANGVYNLRVNNNRGARFAEKDESYLNTLGGVGDIAIEGLQTDVSNKKKAYNDIIDSINDRLLHQNKIAKYRAILEVLFMEKKIHCTKYKIEDLIYFSNAYKERFNNLMDAELALQRAGFSATELSEISESGLSLAPEAYIAQAVREQAKIVADAEVAGKAEVLDTRIGAKMTDDATAAKSKETPASFDPMKSVESLLRAPQGPQPKSTNNNYVYFVYVGDIISAVYNGNGVGDRLHESKIGLILGSVLVSSPSRPSEGVNINIADIPISMKFFMEFFKKNIIERDIDKYPFTKFLQDLATQLVTPAINMVQHSFGKSRKNPIQIKFTNMNMVSPASDGGQNPVALYGNGTTHNTRMRLTPSTIKAYQSFSSERELAISPPDKIWNVFVMYGTPSLGFSLPNNRADSYPLKDRLNENNILYVEPGGKAKNALLAFDFQKVKKKYQTEMMATRSMEDGEEYREAWHVYDITLEFIGNFFFRPGMHVYSRLKHNMYYPNADPLLPAHLGLEGFYLVTNVEHRFDVAGTTGAIRTFVTARWQSSGVSSIANKSHSLTEVGAAYNDVNSQMSTDEALAGTQYTAIDAED
jgi:hypothetical protein